ncbi:Arc family DNA-binding protein [Streptomyces sp. NPDC046909]|uniref:Arc family DNA-binding protein n=1 Tax=Streptomyces sp. NPDC046909 TaxID=3155617 RepID=UPI0033F4A653
MIRFSLRIPEDLHERVTERASADRRSLNSEILHLLEVGLRRAEAPRGSLGDDAAVPARPRRKSSPVSQAEGDRTSI